MGHTVGTYMLLRLPCGVRDHLTERHHKHDAEHRREVCRDLRRVGSEDGKERGGERRLLLEQPVLLDHAGVVALLRHTPVVAVAVVSYGGDQVEADGAGLLTGAGLALVFPCVDGVVRVDGARQVKGEVQRNRVDHLLEVRRRHQDRSLGSGQVAGCCVDYECK